MTEKKIIAAGAAAVLAGVVIGGCYVMGRNDKVQDIEGAYKNGSFNDMKQKLSEDIQTALSVREFISGDAREIQTIVSISFDELKSPDSTSKDPNNDGDS